MSSQRGSIYSCLLHDQRWKGIAVTANRMWLWDSGCELRSIVSRSWRLKYMQTQWQRELSQLFASWDESDGTISHGRVAPVLLPPSLKRGTTVWSRRRTRVPSGISVPVDLARFLWQQLSMPQRCCHTVYFLLGAADTPSQPGSFTL